MGPIRRELTARPAHPQVMTKPVAVPVMRGKALPTMANVVGNTGAIERPAINTSTAAAVGLLVRSMRNVGTAMAMEAAKIPSPAQNGSGQPVIDFWPRDVLIVRPQGIRLRRSIKLGMAMNAIESCRWGGKPVALAAGMVAGLIFTGCGTPGAPLPPSLKLPDPVTDLAASRTGSQVSLAWTMPKRNTDKLLIKGNIPVRVCRKENSGACAVVAGDLSFAPAAHGFFSESLPPDLSSARPRSLAYFVELRNAKGRSAGLSNAAVVLAGGAPDPVDGLSAQLRKDGVVLRWTADPEAASASDRTVIRLHRKLITPLPKSQSAARPSSQQGILAPPPEPIEESLLVESAAEPGRTLDKTIRFGETYEYRAQRVARGTVGGKTLELAGPLSDPVRVEAIDVFPPAVPSGLAAVATAADSGGDSVAPSIDLSWQPAAEADLAGYAVYRREGDGKWQRISPAQPVVGPGLHDHQVQPGHTYRYAVTAIDQGGHESARSVETEETVPNP